MTKLQKTFLAMALFAVVFVATACVPPPPVGSGKARFDWWRQIQIAVFYGDLSQVGGYPCGLADPPNWRVFIDQPCIAGRGDPAGTSPGTTNVYTHYHEYAHDVDENIFHFMFGRDDTPVLANGGVYFQRREQAAQCIGEAILGWTLVPRLAPGVADAIGYWDCPDGHVAWTRKLLTEAGLL